MTCPPIAFCGEVQDNVMEILGLPELHPVTKSAMRKAKIREKCLGENVREPGRVDMVYVSFFCYPGLMDAEQASRTPWLGYQVLELYLPVNVLLG
jgi:hypothetical protein